MTINSLYEFLFWRSIVPLFSLSGVHLKHCKNTAKMKPERIPTPRLVTIPVSMHIGAPALPCVAVGDEVRVGQKIAEAGAGLSSPVYSGVSGKVKKLDEITAVNGAQIRAVVIECDGEQTLSETVTPPEVSDRESFLSALRESGIVGLGGAGFPTAVKLNVPEGRVDTVVVNGAECEPYITSDTRTMLDESELVAEGLSLVMKYLAIPNAIFGIEKNKPECIAKMKRETAALDGVQIRALPSVYPQGGEKVLVYHTTGRVIGEGKLPLDHGVIVINCTTLAAIAKYLRTGMPLVEKCVTVDGSAVKNPRNLIVPIGTSVRDVIEACGGFREAPKKILSGGPMMGVALVDLDAPVLKQTNAVLAFGEREAMTPKETACIRCGKCLESCPFSLAPVAIAKAYEQNDGAMLEKLKVNLCMECGCCSYICPAKRNLVQTNRLAKAALKTYQIKKKENETRGS
ncbi:MAG: electron transport complex subunit RsxC [Clostridia bacterium]|nr:electron transport complex subunit RsxC [Clostridia bacterium]